MALLKVSRFKKMLFNFTKYLTLAMVAFLIVLQAGATVFCILTSVAVIGDQ